MNAIHRLEENIIQRSHFSDSRLKNENLIWKLSIKLGTFTRQFSIFNYNSIVCSTMSTNILIQMDPLKVQTILYAPHSAWYDQICVTKYVIRTPISGATTSTH